MNTHALAGKLTVVYGKLSMIYKKALVDRNMEIRDLAEDGIHQLDMLNKELGADLLQEPKDVMGAV